MCGGITSGSTYDCDSPLQAGMIPRVWLANKSDIAKKINVSIKGEYGIKV